MRCLLVDDSHHFLAAARILLESQGVVVVGTALTSAEALRSVEELRPDVALVDVNLGTESGFDLARRLSRTAGAMPVILISTGAEDDYAALIETSPAAGFLPKATLSVPAIRDILNGDATR
jgi:DNA-binding NarL/FixJ family response regulator